MKSIADLFAAAFARVLVGWMALVPEKLAVLTSRGLIGLLLLCIPRLDRAAARNLEIAFPELSREERDALKSRSYYVLARNLVTFARSSRLTKENTAGAVEGEAQFREILDQARSESGGGVLIATMHFGCFELALQLIALRYQPISALVREFGLPRLDRFWTAKREQFGNELYSRRGGYRETIRRLEAGEIVAILCDQNVKRKHSIFVDFFGTPTSATKTTSMALMNTGAPLVLAAFYEKAPGSYCVISRRIKGLDSQVGERREQLKDCTQRLHSEIEKVIREHPEQWFWIHRRWKTTPEGHPENRYEGV